MPVPDYADQRPAYVQIADDLRTGIRNGEYPAASRLPSMQRLSEHYGVARETIRQALDVLRAEGLVAAQSTRGVFVLREPAEQPSPESEEVRQLREEVRQLREEVEALKRRRPDTAR
jgi:DNA-binding GntR family transcriptional regulator